MSTSLRWLIAKTRGSQLHQKNKRCAAGTYVAVIGGILWFGLTGAVAQVEAHLCAQGSFDKYLLEILEDVFELLLGNGTGYELLH